MYKVTVCMATFNGEKWIECQLNSILSELGLNDEIIIVDDVSVDETCSIISAYSDPRIKLFKNTKNMGVDKTFENALSYADGDIIFLSDQDDVWYRGKVKKVVHKFRTNQDCTLVLSDADIIDAQGNKVGSTYFQKRGAFKGGVINNLIKCKFLGCSMAFRASILNKLLPFPDPIPGHDMWIGIVNEYYGCSYYISDPLIGYRRHGANLSPDSHKGLIQMITWRWILLSRLTFKIFSNYLALRS